jgi:hypothetical protein
MKNKTELDAKYNTTAFQKLFILGTTGRIKKTILLVATYPHLPLPRWLKSNVKQQ